MSTPKAQIVAGASKTPAEPPGPPIVFLSHAAVDAELAEFVEATIRQSVPDSVVFRTSRLGQIPSGRPWFQHITEHLATADKYVVLLTPSSHARPWVNFETGAAWMTGRTLVPVLGGGLAPHDTVEPLKNLQLLSLEVPNQASQAFAELGGRLAEPGAFSERARELGALGARKALDDAGWRQIVFEGRRYAWAGPLEGLREGPGVPLADALVHALQDAGMRLTTGVPQDLLGAYAKGYQPVWYVDEWSTRHPVVSRDKQVLLAKPG